MVDYSQPVVGVILGVIVLMIGYVNVDSKRRGMNSLLWTLLVIFVPKALGFLAYFLLRKPLVTSCPNCGTSIGSEFRSSRSAGMRSRPCALIADAASTAITSAARIAERP